MIKLYAIGGVLALIIILIAWFRYDAVRDRMSDLEKQGSENRIEHIEEARELGDEVREITGDDLRRELCERLSGRSGPC